MFAGTEITCQIEVNSNPGNKKSASESVFSKTPLSLYFVIIFLFWVLVNPFCILFSVLCSIRFFASSLPSFFSSVFRFRFFLDFHNFCFAFSFIAFNFADLGLIFFQPLSYFIKNDYHPF